MSILGQATLFLIPTTQYDTCSRKKKRVVNECKFLVL